MTGSGTGGASGPDGPGGKDTPASRAAPVSPSWHRTAPALLLGLGLTAATLTLALVASLALGTLDVPPATVWAALMAPDGSREHLIVRTVRLPRALIGAVVGAALAVAGTLMQALTRNPLAAPSLLGINAGAALAVVVTVFLLRVSSLAVYAWAAFLGAALAAGAVYALGSVGRGGPSPLKLTVAGAALTALLASLTTTVLLLSQRTLDEVRFWLAGSIAGRDIALFWQSLPYMATGLVLAILLGKQITILSLGEDVARGLGQRTGWVKGLAAGCVVLLAGGSVAVAGPIGFVGLIVPHTVRLLVGVDYRWVLPYAALFGAATLVYADVVARLVVKPQELPVGVMTALLGAPFFLYLAWWKVKR